MDLQEKTIRNVAVVFVFRHRINQMHFIPYILASISSVWFDPLAYCELTLQHTLKSCDHPGI